MSVLGRFLAAVIQRGTLEIEHHDGTKENFGQPEDGYPSIRLRLLDKRVARQIMLDPRLGAAEAFMDGRLVIERGDVMQLVQLLRANRVWERGGNLKESSGIKKLKDRIVSSFDMLNDQVRSKANVAHHYDLSDELYRLFLDDDMQYSCAYWTDPENSLEQAQWDKKAHIAAKLDLKAGQKVLDIGCGWGGMALFLHQQFDVEVLGITLSEEQLKVAKRRAEEAGVSEKVRFELIDYRDLAVREPGGFDRIVSVGMFEHVGRPNFETFFRCAGNLMTSEGVMLLHTIGRMGKPGSTDAFTRKYIFPGGYIPALSETLAASEPSRLIVSDIETLRLHYAYTLRQWFQRTVDNREQIVALYDERFFRMWTFYLAGATAAFEHGGMCNYQIQFSRNRRTLPLTRSYMEAVETGIQAKS